MSRDSNRVRAVLIRALSAVFGSAAVQCREATRLTSERRDRRLSARESISVRVHNKVCPECSAFEKQLESLGDYARSENPCVGFPGEAKKRLLEKLDAEDE